MGAAKTFVRSFVRSLRGRPVRHLLLLAALLAAAGAAQQTQADDTRPAVVELREIFENTYSLRLVPPPGLAWLAEPHIRLPDSCRRVALGHTGQQPAFATQYYECSRGLSGEKIALALAARRANFHTVLRYSSLAGEEHTGVLAPGEREWRVPLSETLGRVSRDYLGYGVVHILKGMDHLLFVLCLIWIAGTWQRILLTITGFTIAHSITLALSALDLMRLATPPIEAGIALSVAFLASEVIRGQRDSLTWRFPMSIASLFGLVHGLGFASVLRDIGLAQLHLIPSLLSFNLGVEIGQILFALPVALLMWQVRTRDWAANALRLTMGYGVGAIAAFWFINRFAAIL